MPLSIILVLQFAIYVRILCMQLRQKLFLVLSLMAMVPLLFLLFEVVGRLESDLESRTAKELFHTLSKMKEEITTLMDNQKSIVSGLSKVPIVREFALHMNERDDGLYEDRANKLMAFFLNYQSTVPSIQAIRFTDINGKSMVKIKEGKLLPYGGVRADGKRFVEDISQKGFFKWAVKTDENISISDFERGKVEGEEGFCPAMLRYTAPIRDELDVPIGLLTVNMWGKRVDDAVQASLGGYPGKAYIVELNRNSARDGVYLYHENDKMRFSNQLGTDHRLSAEIGSALWNSIHEGEHQGMVAPSDRRVLFYEKFSPYHDRETRWLLVIETSKETILAPISNLRNWIIYLILAVLVLSLVVAKIAATSLAKPVHELSEIIMNYAKGNKKVKFQGNKKDEIGKAGDAFNYLTESLERAEKEKEKAEVAVRQSERLAAVGQLAAGIGHEINNPLLNIMSLATLVSKSIPESETQVQEDLRALQNEGKRCARIVHGILNFARETEPSYQLFDCSVMIDDTIAVIEHRLKASQVRLEIDIEHPLMMEGDSGQLQQVLVNLLLNALYASPAGTSISVSAHRTGDSIKMEILDCGNGISEENLPRVFSPFFSTKPEGSGTGLGLSVSYGIVKKHGGTISLENRPEGGLHVTVELPAKGVKPGSLREEEEVRNAG